MRYFMDTEFIEDGITVDLSGEHNALEDARWCKSAYEFLINYQKQPRKKRHG